MSKRTDKYQLAYYEQDDVTNAATEMQRWETLDSQLYALFDVIGNGIKSGWDLISADGLNITISPGSGHVAFVAVESVDSATIENLLQSTTQHIYAEITEDSYWNQTVVFSAYSSTIEDNDVSLYLGSLTTDDVSVTSISTDGRSVLGFQTLINEAVEEHRHIGGTDNPDPIDLASEVQGVLNQQNIPELDASKIQTGTLSEDRIPKIDHTEGITEKGTLTHAQLDAFVEGLSIVDNKKMGEVSTTNLLQLILALKHQYPDIDEYLVNLIAFIPGISPDSYVDTDNTTAEVDFRPFAEGGQHTITMTPTLGQTAYTRIWDTEDDFSDSTQDNIFIDGNSVCLDTTKNGQILDNFSDIDEWAVVTEDLTSATNLNIELDDQDYVVSEASGKVSVTNEETEMALVIKKDFDAQDWSDFDFLTFFIKTEDVEHGDWQFYLTDSVSGIQNSYTTILDRNTPTINVDTLENGWQEVRIDLRGYLKSSINQIALFTSTQLGWDNAKPFNLNLDQFSLSTGNYYKDDGYVRVIYGSDTLVDFWRIRWNSIVPTDSESTGVLFQVRVRNSNTVLGLATAEWSDYFTVSGTELDITDGVLYKYIEIESYFEPSAGNNRTICLKKLYLDFYVSDEDAEFEFDSQTDWETGNLFNIDTTSDPGSIIISNTEDIGTYYYAADGIAGQLDSDFDSSFSLSGSSLPITTYQSLNAKSTSFGYLSSVLRGDDGSLWVSDIDNDRVVKVDKYGNLIVGLYGSNLSEPKDFYGIEDSGPGSNVAEGEASEVTKSSVTSFEVLHSSYNVEEGDLHIVFNDVLSNIYDASNAIDMSRLYVKVGALRFNLADSDVELVGISKEKFGIWGDLNESSGDAVEFADHFSYTSHILKLSLNGSEKTALNSALSNVNPSIAVGSPFQNFKTAKTSVKVNFSLRNVTLGSDDDEHGIKLTIDGGVPVIIYDDNYTFTGLSIGDHVVEIVLVDDSDVELTNDEANTSLTFVRQLSYSDPYLSIQYPRPNQIYSNDSIVAEFTMENFPIVPSGQHIQYYIDSEPPVDYYSTDPIEISNLDPGKHTLRIYSVDEKGNKLSYNHDDISTEFIIGINLNATLKLYVDNGAVTNSDGASVETSRTNTDVANIYFRNIYSPVDLQVLPSDTSGVAGSEMSILVSKLRSPSWSEGLSGQSNADEVVLRAENVAREASGEDLLTPDPDLENVPTNMLIFNSNYLDGHSVTQLNDEGELLFSNNSAKFAENRTRAKILLGSAEKIGPSELLIGDSLRKRAITVHTDLETTVPEILWQYDSDRFVPDFHIAPQEQIVISILDDSISESSAFIRQGVTIVWENNSASPVTIYSGTTILDLFNQDPDLTLYGDLFTSPVLDPGDTYSYEFVSEGEFDWFVYPDILTGKITVTKQRLSSRDLYYILESDGLESPFTSRLIKVDSWGNALWSFGEGLIVQPRDVRPMINGNVLLST
jgi:hypothetical protein